MSKPALIQRAVWGLGMIAALSLLTKAEEPGNSLETPPSKYAPAEDLAAQVKEYVDSIETDLESEEDYTKDVQGRVEKSANTLVVLAVVLGKHDAKSDLQAAASALAASAKRLASDSKDFQKATSALAEVKKALETTGDAGQVEWESGADLQQLMKQVPIVNNSLRRRVTGRRFDRSIDDAAGEAATLAAIAQLSAFDTSYCVDEEDEAKWEKICIDMRDACAEVHAAVRAKDQEAATKGLDKIVLTCDACHHAFRD